jgi:alpha-soluble NSF attachment protein
MSAIASAQRKKAIDFQSQAVAALQKKSWFASGRERNQEEAAELYVQAANAYKVGGFGHEAGTAYTEAGAIYRDSIKNPTEASKCYSSAGAFVLCIQSDSLSYFFDVPFIIGWSLKYVFERITFVLL